MCDIGYDDATTIYNKVPNIILFVYTMAKGIANWKWKIRFIIKNKLNNIIEKAFLLTKIFAKNLQKDKQKLTLVIKLIKFENTVSMYK